MYGIFTYIHHKNELNEGKYISYMDGMGKKWPEIKGCLGDLQKRSRIKSRGVCFFSSKVLDS